MATIEGTNGNNNIDQPSNNNSDVYYGYGGHDVLGSGGGNDTLYGGTGNDSVRGDGGNDVVHGDEGNDTVHGDAGNDSLFGGIGNDVLLGGADNDTLDGGSGNDNLQGEGGTDTASYASSTAGVAVTINGSANTGGDAQGDTLSGIENLIGSAFADTLTGDALANQIEGGAGADAIFGGAGIDTLYGGAGNDTIDGGAGAESLFGGADTDTVTYASATSGVNVNLATGVVSGGGGADTIAQFENIIGSGFNDTLTGDGNANVIDGGGGRDTISAGAGNDTVVGDMGNDTIDAGSGDDVITAGPDTAGGSTVGLDFNWNAYSDEQNLAGGVTQNTGGISVNVSYAAGGGNQFTAETTDTIYVAGGEPFNPNSAGFLNRPGAGAATTVNMNFSAVAGSGFSNEVQNVQFRISDIDKEAWTDRIIIRAYDANGNLVLVTLVESSSEITSTSALSGSTILATGNNTEANLVDGSVLVQVAGPVARIEIVYDNAAASNQYIYVSDVHFQAIDIADDDSVLGGDGNDTIFGGIGNDTLVGGADNDRLYGGTGNDNLSGGTGNDSLDGGAGNDTILFGSGNDTVLGGDGDDYIDDVSGLEENGFNLIFGGAGNDTVWAGNDNDTVSGDAGNDLLMGDAGDDSVSGGTGSDTIHGGTGNDTLDGGADNDSILGDAGNDSVAGGSGNDTLVGGDGEDTLLGDAGRDSIVGGVGNDRILGGAGDDSLYGEDGNDVFVYAITDLEADGDSVVGFEFVDGGGSPGEAIATDNDTLDLSAYGSTYGWAQVVITYAPGSTALDLAGTVNIYSDPAHTILIGTIHFDEFEHIIPCFTPGTMIMTDRGEVAVEALVAGDLVVTRDRGLQALRWVGRRDLSYLDLLASPDLQPVRIGCGALGAERTMLVSAQHRVLIEGAGAEMLFGEAEVLVAAKHLVGLADVTRALPSDGVSFIHLLFDRHEIVQSDGIWTESFQPAERMLSAMDAEVRDEVLALFPELESNGDAFVAARLSLKAHEARALLRA